MTDELKADIEAAIARFDAHVDRLRALEVWTPDDIGDWAPIDRYGAAWLDQTDPVASLVMEDHGGGRCRLMVEIGDYAFPTLGILWRSAAEVVAGAITTTRPAGRHAGWFADAFAPLLAWADDVRGDDPVGPASLWKDGLPVAVLMPLSEREEPCVDSRGVTP